MKSVLLAASLSFAAAAAAASSIEASYQTDGPVAPIQAIAAPAPEAPLLTDPVPFRPTRLAGPATTTRFCNAGALQFATGGTASDYPSTIVVDGLNGVVTDAKVLLRDVTHSDTSTLWLRLESPGGQVVGLNGSAFVVPQSAFPAVSHVDWTFTDEAAKYTLFFGSAGNWLSWTAPTDSDAYLPRSFAAAEQPAPAPASLPRQLLSSLEGSGPNGVWRLWASQKVRAEPQPGGEIGAGWCLDITTAPAGNDCYFSTTRTGTIDMSPQQQGRLWRDGRPTLCHNPPLAALQNTSPVRYDRQDFAPFSTQPVCLTVTADFTQCGGKQAQIALYSEYNPATPQTGLLGHSGYSTNQTISLSTRLTGNQAFTAVVNEVAAGDGCPNYTLHLEANTCVPVPPPGDRIFADDFNTP